MSLKDKIERLVESRQAEAVQKDLSKKLRTIARGYGFAIRDKVFGGGGLEGGTDVMGHSSHVRFDDWSELPEDNQEMPTDPDIEESVILAYHFDGMSCGINLQIHFEESADLIKATYEGREVYREQQGQLTAYIPSPKWETTIESLFPAAAARVKLITEQQLADDKNRKRKFTEKMLDYLREHWGV